MKFESNLIIQEDLELITSASLPWEDLRNKTVMVTGGGGFLASYLIKALLFANAMHSLNIKVVCVVRCSGGGYVRLKDWISNPNLAIYHQDISETLQADFPHADIIIHAASQASPKYYGVDPVGTLSPNSIGTLQLLQHALRSNVSQFVFISSGEVYGNPLSKDNLISEIDFGSLDPVNVRSCYAESKRMGEAMCAAWGHQYDLHTNIIRPFHTYGPGIALNDGRVFADFVAAVVERRDIHLSSDGAALRPFCYLTDAIVGFLTILFKGQKGNAYNIGNPDAEISIRELAYLVANLFPERNIGVNFGSEKNSLDVYGASLNSLGFSDSY
jgi:nucleoside-diphosphate-sugar epimerase